MIPPTLSATRGIFCNRTLNLRRIRAIGYDMDYTLVHYHVDQWEGQAYEYIKMKLVDRGWPVEGLEFDPSMAIRGLVVDMAQGNLLKVNRFGYIKRAAHGTQVMDYRSMKRAYASTLVDLGDPRYYFLNTLFSISEASIFSQLVDLYDQDALPGVSSYMHLYGAVRSALDAAHVEGKLKAEIMTRPERYVDLDPDLPLTLLDQKHAGKRLILITNSEWSYTRFMMQYAFDQFLPGSMTWHDLFEVKIVSARKPEFFTGSSPMLRVHQETGLLEPFVGPLQEGGLYFGGTAARLESYLGLTGAEIMYVGDHLLTDVNLTKTVLRWRTALILREIEHEIEGTLHGIHTQENIRQMMRTKEHMEEAYSQLRLRLQRFDLQYGPAREEDPEALRQEMASLRERLVALDAQIAPLAIEDSQTFNTRWGYLMRTGNDKSHLTRQIERYADLYTSRVSNFLTYTPFMYFRAPRGSIPHDQALAEHERER